jgi:RIO kinase 1
VRDLPCDLRAPRAAPPHGLEVSLPRSRYDPDDATESFAKRKDRRRPHGRVRARSLFEGTASVPGMAWLRKQGIVTSVDAELRSGKEATVYVGRGPAGTLALKVYRDRSVRSFKADGRYEAGRFEDGGATKAIAAAGARGRRAQTARWALHEYRTLWRLHRAGVPVPEPLVGPGTRLLARSGDVVVMRYLGDDDGPAPRLADAGLSGLDAERAFARSVEHLATLWRLGVVHGDYSTYNLLWWQGEVDRDRRPAGDPAAPRRGQDAPAPRRHQPVRHVRALGVEADVEAVVSEVEAAAPAPPDEASEG